jgi:hypothetical protein
LSTVTASVVDPPISIPTIIEWCRRLRPARHQG